MGEWSCPLEIGPKLAVGEASQTIHKKNKLFA